MKYPKFLEKINHKLAVISGGLIFIIGALSVAEVFIRNIFRPTSWTLDLSMFSLIWAIFVGAGYTFQEKGHVRVDLLTDKLKPLPKRIVTTAGYVVALGFVATLGYSIYNMMNTALRFNRMTVTMVQIPQAYLIAGMLIGCGLMIITVLAIIADLIGGGDKYM